MTRGRSQKRRHSRAYHAHHGNAPADKLPPPRAHASHIRCNLPPRSYINVGCTCLLENIAAKSGTIACDIIAYLDPPDVLALTKASYALRRIVSDLLAQESRGMCSDYVRVRLASDAVATKLLSPRRSTLRAKIGATHLILSVLPRIEACVALLGEYLEHPTDKDLRRLERRLARLESQFIERTLAWAFATRCGAAVTRCLAAADTTRALWRRYLTRVDAGLQKQDSKASIIITTAFGLDAQSTEEDEETALANLLSDSDAPASAVQLSVNIVPTLAIGIARAAGRCYDAQMLRMARAHVDVGVAAGGQTSSPRDDRDCWFGALESMEHYKSLDAHARFDLVARLRADVLVLNAVVDGIAIGRGPSDPPRSARTNTAKFMAILQNELVANIVALFGRVAHEGSAHGMPKEPCVDRSWITVLGDVFAKLTALTLKHELSELDGALSLAKVFGAMIAGLTQRASHHGHAICWLIDCAWRPIFRATYETGSDMVAAFCGSQSASNRGESDRRSDGVGRVLAYRSHSMLRTSFANSHAHYRSRYHTEECSALSSSTPIHQIIAITPDAGARCTYLSLRRSRSPCHDAARNEDSPLWRALALAAPACCCSALLCLSQISRQGCRVAHGVAGLMGGDVRALNDHDENCDAVVWAHDRTPSTLQVKPNAWGSGLTDRIARVVLVCGAMPRLRALTRQITSTMNRLSQSKHFDETLAHHTDDAVADLCARSNVSAVLADVVAKAVVLGCGHAASRCIAFSDRLARSGRACLQRALSYSTSKKHAMLCRWTFDSLATTCGLGTHLGPLAPAHRRLSWLSPAALARSAGFYRSPTLLRVACALARDQARDGFEALLMTGSGDVRAGSDYCDDILQRKTSMLYALARGLRDSQPCGDESEEKQLVLVAMHFLGSDSDFVLDVPSYVRARATFVASVLCSLGSLQVIRVVAIRWACLSDLFVRRYISHGTELRGRV